MAVKLVFLGRLEDVAGAGERDVAGGVSLDALLNSLEPELAAALRGPKIKLAINGALVVDRTGVTLKDGEELAFLPPVSGG
jgi:molybdopterin synthase sulfur carrier subunit